MRLFERVNPSEPLFLKGVTIHFTHASLLETPKRTGTEITFPFHRGIELFEFEDKKSCLLVTKKTYPTGQFCLWFCGSEDESAFLTELRISCFSAFVTDGEDAFRESLKPEWLRCCEKHYQVRTKQQGNTFACEMPGVEWSTLREMHQLSTGEELKITNSENLNLICGTDRRFTGYSAKMTLFGHTNVCVGSGIIEETPDYKALTLEKPHIICQSAGLPLNPGSS